MTDTTQSQQVAGPLAGWYPDPAGSPALRWWNGVSWTDALQPPPTPAFGSAAARTTRLHAAPAAAIPRGTRKLVVIVAAVVLVLVLVAVVLLKTIFASDDAATPPVASPGGLIAEAKPTVASLAGDAGTLAEAEETVFADEQVYVRLPSSSGAADLHAVHVVLTAGNVASISLSAVGTAYCIAVHNKAGTRVYVSDLGGIMPPVVTACPAPYAS